MRKHAESRRADARGDQNDCGFAFGASMANEIRPSPPAVFWKSALPSGACRRRDLKPSSFQHVFEPAQCTQGDSQRKEPLIPTPSPPTMISKNRSLALPLPRVIHEIFPWAERSRPLGRLKLFGE